MIIAAILCLVCTTMMAQRNGDSPVYQHGNKVYIPYSDKDVAQKAGAMKLRDLITRDQLWNVVEDEKDAQFILDFYYSEKGRDHGIVNIKDKNGNLIASTPKVKDLGKDLQEKGEEIAETSYDKYVSKIGTKLKIEDGRLLISGRRRGWVFRPEFGIGEDIMEFHTRLSLSLAYQFGPNIAIGGSLCREGSYNESFYSLCGNFRYYFCEKPWSPFVDIKAGPCIIQQHRNRTIFTYRVSGTIGCQYKGFDLGCSVANFDEDIFLYSLNVAYNIQLRKKL